MGSYLCVEGDSARLPTHDSPLAASSRLGRQPSGLSNRALNGDARAVTHTAMSAQ